jgi:hypothetical protein
MESEPRGCCAAARPRRAAGRHQRAASHARDQLPDAYRLRAFLPDCTFEIIGGDTSDWFAMPCVLALLNTLCQHRDSPVRFVALPPDGQRARVIARSADELRHSIANGSLVLAPAEAAETAGREFEAAAIEAIRRARR